MRHRRQNYCMCTSVKLQSNLPTPTRKVTINATNPHSFYLIPAQNAVTPLKAPHLTTNVLPRIDVTCGELVELHSEKLTVKALERPPLPPQLDQPLAVYYVLQYRLQDPQVRPRRRIGGSDI